MRLKRLILHILLFSTSNALPIHPIFQFAFYPWALFYNVIFKIKNNESNSKKKYLSLIKGPSYIPKTFDFHHFNIIATQIDPNILEESIAFCPSQLKDILDKRTHSIKFFDKNKLILPCTTRLLLCAQTKMEKQLLHIL